MDTHTYLVFRLEYTFLRNKQHQLSLTWILCGLLASIPWVFFLGADHDCSSYDMLGAGFLLGCSIALSLRSDRQFMIPQVTVCRLAVYCNCMLIMWWFAMHQGTRVSPLSIISFVIWQLDSWKMYFSVFQVEPPLLSLNGGTISPASAICSDKVHW